MEELIFGRGDENLVEGGESTGEEFFELENGGRGGTLPIPPVGKTLKYVHQKSGYNIQRLNQVLLLSPFYFTHATIEV